MPEETGDRNYKGGDGMDEHRILYLCDGAVPTCSKTHCYRNGGTCFKTSDIEHAVNFKKWGSGSYSEISQLERAEAREGPNKEALVPDDLIDLP